MIGDGKILKQSILYRFKTLCFINIENAKVFDEIMFSVSKRLTIPSSPAKLDIVMDPTGCDCSDLIFLPAVFKALGAGPIHIDFYFGTDSDDDGTLWQSINRDHNSSNDSHLDIRLNPTINNPGTLLPTEFIILSNGVAATSEIGGESKDGQMFKARKDGKYMLRLLNQEANPAHSHVSLNWFELP
jgi:hypothetical protein